MSRSGMEWRELTGKTRHRIDTPLFGAPRLVLEVECRVAYHDWMGGYADTNYGLKWRDARVEDLGTLFVPNLKDMPNHEGTGPLCSHGDKWDECPVCCH